MTRFIRHRTPVSAAIAAICSTLAAHPAAAQFYPCSNLIAPPPQVFVHVPPAYPHGPTYTYAVPVGVPACLPPPPTFVAAAPSRIKLRTRMLLKLRDKLSLTVDAVRSA